MERTRFAQAQREVLAEVPVHEPFYPFFYRESRAVPCNFPQLIHAGVSFINVTGLHGQQTNVRWSAQTSLNGAQQVEKLDRLLISDIAESHRSL